MRSLSESISLTTASHSSSQVILRGDNFFSGHVAGLFGDAIPMPKTRLQSLTGNASCSEGEFFKPGMQLIPGSHAKDLGKHLVSAAGFELEPFSGRDPEQREGERPLAKS
jgi:hypothetical protein